MAAQGNLTLPCGVIVDTKGKKAKMRKKTKSAPMLKLLFQQKCPEASEVQKLHPAIQFVFIPSRPSNVRYCILKLPSANACEEVRSALHGKHIEPYQGILKCTSTTTKILSETRHLKQKLLKDARLTRPEVKLLKIHRQTDIEVTEDVKCNSTARELLVRYGITCSKVTNLKPCRELRKR